MSGAPSFYMAYDSSSGHSIPAGYESFYQDGFLHLFFDLIPGFDLISRTVCLYVPVGNTKWPYSASTSSAIHGTMIYQFVTTIGSDVTTILSSSSIGSQDFGFLFLEPAQYISIGGVAIDSLSIVHATGGIPDRYLNGDVKFLPGLNTSVTQSGNSIVLVISPGYGLGNNTNYGTGNGVCDGAIISINGVSPTDVGQFYIRGSSGVIIYDDPSTNTIRIAIDPNNNASECP